MKPATEADARHAADGLSPWVLRMFWPPHRNQHDSPCGLHGGNQRHVGDLWDRKCYVCAVLARARMLLFIVEEARERGAVKAAADTRLPANLYQGHHTHKAWEWVRSRGFVSAGNGKCTSGTRYALAHDAEERAEEAAVFVNRLLTIMGNGDA